MLINCSNCGRQVLPPPPDGAGAGAGCATDSRDFEPCGAKMGPGHITLAKGNRPSRSLEVIRRELLEAHRQHCLASDLQDAAEKAASHARHNTVERLGVITRLRDEILHMVERPNEQELCG